MKYLLLKMSVFVKLLILFYIYMNLKHFYLKILVFMMNIFQIDKNVKQHQQACYFLGSRPLTHVLCWLVYYLLFSVIWIKPETGTFASFYLEFILLPLRMMAVYCMIYWLLPNFLLKRRYQQFFMGYLVLLIVSGCLLRVFDHYFYQQLLLNESGNLLSFSSLVRSIVLLNSTVVFVSMLKVLQLYFIAQDMHSKVTTSPSPEDKKNIDPILTLKANRRTHYIKTSQILYIESMGNYVSYFLSNNEKIVVYSSLKASLLVLPENFIRLQRSYVINVQHIQSYSHENVVIKGVTLPRGPDISDHELQPLVLE